MSDQAEIERKLTRIKQAIKERHPDEARQLLIEVLKADPQNADAWFVSSFLIKDPAAQLDAAQRALNINPNFAAAQKRLQELQTRQKGPTPLASVFDQELEESVSMPTAPPLPPAAPAPNVFNTRDEATLITPRSGIDDAPFEPAVTGEAATFDETHPTEATNIMTPPSAASALSDATVVNQRLPFDEPAADDVHASEPFPFDEPTAPPAAPSDQFSFDEATPLPAAGVFTFDNPPMPGIDALTSFDEPPPKIAATEASFEDLLRADPDSARAAADADILMLEDPLGSPSKPKRTKSGKGGHVSLDRPYDPSVRQPRLATGRKARQRAVKAAKQRSQNQSLLLLMLGLMLIFVLAAGAFLLLRPQLGSLFSRATATSQPVIVPTAAPPTATLIPTDLPPTSAPALAPTSLPTLTPTDVPPLAATSLPPTQTLTPSPPPSSTGPPATSAPLPTVAPLSTGVGSNIPLTPGSAGDAQTLAAFRDQIDRGKRLIRNTDFPRLGAANAGQIVPLARIAIPGLFSVLFHDGQPTLIFQISGFAARDSATFAIASLLDDQPLIRVSFQAAAALGTIFLSDSQKKMVSVSADQLTVIDPAQARVLRTIASSTSASALSPDGHFAATASNISAAVLLWNTDSGKLERTITLDGLTAERGPNSLIFSADSRMLAVGGCDGSLRVIDVTSGDARTIQSGDESFDCFDVIRFSPDGAYLLAANNSGFGRFRVVATSGFSNLTYSGLDANPRPQVALSADGRLIAGMNADFLLLWDFTSGQALARQPLDSTTRIDGLTFSADGRFVIAATRGSFDGLTWWGVASGPLAVPATATSQAQIARSTATADALSAAIRGSGRVIFARPLEDGNLGLFALEPGASSATLLTQSLSSLDGGQPFSLTADGRQMTFVTPTGIAVAAPDSPLTSTRIELSGERPLLSPDGHYLLFRQNDGQCGIAQVADGKTLPFLGDRLECDLTSAVWSPDSHSLAVEQLYGPDSGSSAARATQILLMQVAPSGVSAPVMVGPDSPRALDPAFRPDGQLTYLMFDVAARNYGLFSGSDHAARLATIPGSSTYHAHVWSPDGQRVALVEATTPEQVLVLDADGSLIARIPGDPLSTQVDSLAWSPDGRFIAASRSARDHTQAHIFVYSADGALSAPLTDGSAARWIP